MMPLGSILVRILTMRVLDPVMESLPDQGIEKQSKDGQKKKSQESGVWCVARSTIRCAS